MKEHHWTDIDYLRKGNHIQQKTYTILTETEILRILHKFTPIVIGTIPIEIDIPGSDIDIACSFSNLHELKETITDNFSSYNSFSEKVKENGSIYVAHFEYHDLPIEIYAEALPTNKQNGYRHMLVENRILQIAGNLFRQQIIDLKMSGYKTEPAFGKLLSLENPYQDLLLLESLSEQELRTTINEKYFSNKSNTN